MSLLSVSHLLGVIVIYVNVYSVTGAPCENENLSQCVTKLVAEANKQQRSFLSVTSLSVLPLVTYSSDKLMFSACCHDVTIPAKITEVDPFVKQPDSPFVFSQTPVVRLRPTASYSLTGKMVTYLMVDPDVPFATIATADLPLVHWLVLNSPDGNITSGDEVRSYSGPKPPDKTHQYFIMVYEQTTGTLNLTAADRFFPSCPNSGRCLFNVTAFARENSLSLIGTTWLHANSDLWIKKLSIDRGQDKACEGVQGYAIPCPTGSAEQWHKSLLFIISTGMLSLLLTL